MNAVRRSAINHLILDNNSWTCDCAVADFVAFTREKFIHNNTNIVCSENNKPFSELKISDFCYDSISDSDSDSKMGIIISMFLTFVALTLTIITVFYCKCNKEIKVWLYAHQYCLCLLAKDDLEEEKPYDAFISYSTKDEHFVMTELVEKLESGPQPYKLCLPNRDWLEGELIPSQISRSVEQSKRTIIVLSKNYVSSVWGATEFLAAPKQALLENKAKVIVIIYGNVPSDNELDAEHKAYLKSDVYLQWGNKWFWDRLRYVMPHRPRI